MIINVAQDVLSDLQPRLKNTRWSYQMEGTGWDAGTDINYLKRLIAYWQANFDWRKGETTLNQFHQMGIPLTQVAPTDCGLPLVFPEVG